MPDELISTLELDGIRADAEQLFVDECTVRRPATDATFDTDTETLTPGTETPIYSGRCSGYPMSARRDRFAVQGEGLIYIRQYRVIFPWDVDDIQVDDLIRFTVSDDPQIIGRRLEIRDVFVSTILGYRRVTAHDVEK